MVRCLLVVLLAGLVLAATPGLHADIKVPKRTDKVVLKNGQTIEGVIAAETETLLLVIDKEKKEERLIERAQIERIERGPDEGGTLGFKTVVENGLKIVRGEGFEEAGPMASAKPARLGKVEPKPAGAGTDSTAQAGGKEAPKDAGEGGNFGPPQLPPELIAQAYFTRYPQLKKSLELFGALDRARETLRAAAKGDPAARAQLQRAVELTDPALLPRPAPKTADKPVTPAK